MYMKNEIITNSFWLNTFKNDLTRHNEILSLFCSLIMYHLDDLHESNEITFKDSHVRKSLFELTLSVHSLNIKATKNDIMNNIRMILENYLDNYDTFERYLSNQIPKVTSDEIFFYSVIHSESFPIPDE